MIKNTKLDEISKKISDEIDIKNKASFEKMLEETPKYTEDQLNQFKSKFEKIKSDNKVKARKFVEESVKFFLNLDKLDDNDYMEIVIESRSMNLANLMFQLDIANDTIYKIYQDITFNEDITPRKVEVLTGMQRLALDIVKFQSELFKKIEEFLIKLRDHNQILGVEEDIEESSNQAYSLGEMMGKIDNAIIESNHQMYMKESKNPRLSGNDIGEHVEDKITIEKFDEFDENE